MKNKKFTAATLGLALTAVLAVGSMTAFAADTSTKITEPKAAQTATKDTTGKTTSFDKASITFVGIDAVAAEVLGVTAESLAGQNHANELYAKLESAGKVDEFKTALIAAKQAQYDAKAAMGKFSAEQLNEKLAGYTQTINDWDGTTELVVTSMKNKVK